MSSRTTVRVPPDLDMVRCDRVIAVVLDLPRSEVRRIIEAGAATLDGAVVKPAQQLPAGAELVVDVPEQPPGLVPAPVDFEVVVEDDAFIVVDKPAGIVVHPGAGTDEPTLIAGLVHRFPELAGLADHRWGLVHRLDRDTSSLLVVARSAAAHASLQEALRKRRITRRYLALVVGEPEGTTGTIDAPIGRDRNNPTRQALRHDGRNARTHYRRLASWPEVSLMAVRLETGRTHQIRVHFAGIDHPVVGDRVYGGRGHHAGDPGRQWLHARRLEFEHPSSGSPVSAESALPPDLVASLRSLGDPASGAIPDTAPGVAGED